MTSTLTLRDVRDTRACVIPAYISLSHPIPLEHFSSPSRFYSISSISAPRAPVSCSTSRSVPIDSQSQGVDDAELDLRRIEHTKVVGVELRVHQDARSQAGQTPKSLSLYARWNQARKRCMKCRKDIRLQASASYYRLS